MNLTDFFNKYEFIKKLQNHLTVNKENLLNDFSNTNIEKSLNQLLLSPSNAYLSKEIIPQTFADMTWKFKLIEEMFVLQDMFLRLYFLHFLKKYSLLCLVPYQQNCILHNNFQ